MTRIGSTADLSRPLAEPEIGELADLLDALPEERNAFDVPMLEGYLAGVLLQPELVMPADWLPPIFGVSPGEPMIPGDDAQVARVLGLVMRHHNTLAAHIMAREPFDPIVWTMETEDGSPITREHELASLWPWAVGFQDALSRFPALLNLADNEPGLDEPLMELFRHIPLDPEVDVDDDAMRELRGEREHLDREDPIDGVDEALERLVDAVLDIAEITRRRIPVVRAQPKVGRNDPCPCGSGRKYKQCHGREGG